MDFTKVSALVTGGGGGLGGATCRKLAELGAGVVVFDPVLEKAKVVADEIGPRAVPFAGDHNADSDVLAAIAAAQKLGAFSICVNAAGVVIKAPQTASADGTPHDMQTFRDNVELHLMGPFNVCRLSAAAMAGNPPDEDGQRGVIVNTSSTAAFEGQAHQVAYSTCKAAIAGMTPTMARDLAHIGVRVCAIAPGPTWTPRFASAPPHLQAELLANLAFPKRFGKAEEYALLVEMIARTTFLNGQVIRFDAAMSTPLTKMGVRED